MGENRDEELQNIISRAVAGDKVAFSMLYDCTIRNVSGTVRFLLDDKAGFEDVVQEIYIEVYKSLPKFDLGRSFHSWVIGIAIRQVNSYRRKTWRLFRLLEKNRQYETQGIEPDFAANVADRLDSRELVEQIDRLPYKYRQVIVLRYLHEYSQEEIARVLGIPIGTVKSRIHTALRKLKGGRSAEEYFLRKVGERHGL
ncbi:sigma-70 family RNA polymerase sigma factor [Aneurinibacillus aneurinilyticus]|jgi:RNA polymerase sigma-70 factor (ECF subfamily)|uniref:Sigma-70 family RNA polymerase sigma factor n=1 Tax=Aneurinibacillus aneurinilyticus TaxID=1391 RepID=A0A848CZT4_ANEAE|nr:sigma-70 family RNA polymerase sigma factor [Aneurinibacillus aneurinilyticus]MCI1696363.1 sigma-70 family RNA polymerase sigma factor [Aneurinibacillus aneurinilyticus]NME98770.1 sigma-70 family RNA polymerase sigma factor [Aneurinibacillus aneurinilyticus]